MRYEVQPDDTGVSSGFYPSNYSQKLQLWSTSPTLQPLVSGGQFMSFYKLKHTDFKRSSSSVLKFLWRWTISHLLSYSYYITRNTFSFQPQPQNIFNMSDLVQNVVHMWILLPIDVTRPPLCMRLSMLFHRISSLINSSKLHHRPLSSMPVHTQCAIVASLTDMKNLVPVSLLKETETTVMQTLCVVLNVSYAYYAPGPSFSISLAG